MTTQRHDTASLHLQRRWEMAKYISDHLKDKTPRNPSDFARNDKLTYMTIKRPLPTLNFPKQRYNDENANRNQHTDQSRQLKPQNGNTEINNDDTHKEQYLERLTNATSELSFTIGEDYKISNIIEHIIEKNDPEAIISPPPNKENQNKK